MKKPHRVLRLILIGSLVILTSCSAKETPVQYTDRFIITVAHIPEMDYSSYVCLYKDVSSDIAIYEDISFKTAIQVGATVYINDVECTVISRTDKEVEVKPNDSSIIKDGLSGTPITCNSIVVGYVSYTTNLTTVFCTMIH